MRMMRKLVLAASVFTVGLALFGTTSVSAVNECGPLTPGGTVSCANPNYPTGISYTTVGGVIVDGTGTPVAIVGPLTASTTSSSLPSSITTRGTVTLTRSGATSTNNVGSWASAAVRNFSIDLSAATSIQTQRTTANGYNYAVSAGGTNSQLFIHSAATVRAIHSGGGYTYLTPIVARDFNGGSNSRVEVESTGLVYADVTNATSGTVWAIYAGSTGVGSPLPVKAMITNAVLVQSNAAGAGVYGVAIQVANYGAGSTDVNQSGSVELKGSYAGAYGIYTEGHGNSNITVSAPLIVGNTSTDLLAETYGILVSNDKKATLHINNSLSASGSGLVNAIMVTPYTASLTTSSYDITVANAAAISASGTGIDVSKSGAGGVLALDSGTSLTAANGKPAILGSPANDTITSSAAITGDIDLGKGDDSLTINGGSLHGVINGGDGNDRIEIHGSTDTTGLTSLDGGSGDNVLVIDGAALAGFTSSGSGIAIKNFKTIQVIDDAKLTFGGNDLITTLGDIIVAPDATLESGKNTGNFLIGGNLEHQGLSRCSKHLILWLPTLLQ